MILYNTNGKQFSIDDTPLKSGGEGAVHLVLSQGRIALAAKIFKKPTDERRRRVSHMVQYNPFVNAQQMVQESFAWPHDLLFDKSGDFQGFIMPLVSDAEDLYQTTIASGFSRSDFVKFNINQPNSYNTRLRILYNLSSALGTLCKSGAYRVVDLKPPNIMLKKNGHVAIIDCDSFQISNGNNVLFEASAYTDEYCPPEFFLRGSRLNYCVEPNWDYFCFAVIAYQLLFCIHPFQASHFKLQTIPELIAHGIWANGSKASELQVIPKPHSNFSNLIDPSLQNLFKLCFDDGYSNPTLRPNFDNWQKALLEEIHRLNNKDVSAGSNQPKKQKPKPRVYAINNHQTIGQPVYRPATINRFRITACQYQAVISWDVSHASACYINNIPVAPHGTQSVRLISQTFELRVVDSHGVVTIRTKQFIAPEVTTLLTPVRLNPVTVKLNRPIPLSASVVKLNKPIQLNSTTVKLNESTVALSSPVSLKPITVTLNEPITAINSVTQTIQTPVTLKSPTILLNKPVSLNKPKNNRHTKPIKQRINPKKVIAKVASMALLLIALFR